MPYAPLGVQRSDNDGDSWGREAGVDRVTGKAITRKPVR